MDSFDDSLQKFSSTIYGFEMKKELYNCFNFIKIEVERYSSKIDEAKDKINELYGGG